MYMVFIIAMIGVVAGLTGYLPGYYDILDFPTALIASGVITAGMVIALITA